MLSKLSEADFAVRCDYYGIIRTRFNLSHSLIVFGLSDGMLGRIANFKVNTGSDADMQYMLAMRQNMVHYVNLIDMYAPCIVSSEAWNNTSRMKTYCGDSMQLFQNHILSVSDEAFLLLILINYTATWKAELDLEMDKVCYSCGVNRIVTMHGVSHVNPC